MTEQCTMVSAPIRPTNAEGRTTMPTSCLALSIIKEMNSCLRSHCLKTEALLSVTPASWLPVGMPAVQQSCSRWPHRQS